MHVRSWGPPMSHLRATVNNSWTRWDGNLIVAAFGCPHTRRSTHCGEQRGNGWLRLMMLSIHDGCRIPSIPENHGFLGTTENVSRETGASNGPPMKPQLCFQFLGGRQFWGSRMGGRSLTWNPCLPTELDFLCGDRVAAAHTVTRMDLVPARLDRFIPMPWLLPISDPTRLSGHILADHQKGQHAGTKYIGDDFRSNSLWPGRAPMKS